MFSRKGKDFSARFPSVTRALDALPDETLIDGEVVAVDERGRPSFSALQNFDRAPVYYAFDLLTLSGDDLMKRTLDTAPQSSAEADTPARRSDSLFRAFDTSPSEMIAVVREQGLEGIVAKRLDSFYEPGKRSGVWVKLRVNRRQNFIVGGYIPRGANFDSILVGYYDGHELKYAGSVRAGFTPASRREVFARCSKLEASECPFSNLPDATKCVGCRDYGGKDGGVPLAQTTNRGRDRFPRVDAGQSFAPSFICRA